MKNKMSMTKNDVRCPVCGSEALYRYGTVRSGLQRMRCIVCNRQFIPGHERDMITKRPVCPECGSLMHLYRREPKALRFRCSTYPECRKYTTIMNEEALERGMLCS